MKEPFKLFATGYRVRNFSSSSEDYTATRMLELTDMDGVMHENVGLRVRNLALYNLTSLKVYNNNYRLAFTGTATKGSRYENIYMEGGTVALIDEYAYSGVKTGSFSYIVAHKIISGAGTSIAYFPWASGGSYTWTNIEAGGQMHTLGIMD